MKKSLVIILLVCIVFILSCKDVVVYYPIPLTLRAKFLVEASGGTFADSLWVTTDTLFDDLQNELNKTGLTWDDIDRIKLEGAAYTIYDPTVPNVVANGTCDIAYASLVFVHILTINDFDLTVNEGITNVDPLTINGVALLNQAWDDFLIQLQASQGANPILLIGVKASGTLNTPPPGNVTFTMVVEFTTTAVVKQKQRTFNIFG